MHDRAQTAVSPLTANVPLSRTPSRAVRDPLIFRAILALGIAIYIICMASWAFKAGLQIRNDAWTTTRTIRFEGDIRNAIGRWGTMVVQTAQEWANYNAKQNGHPELRYVVTPNPDNKNERALSFWDLVHGVDQVYQNMVYTEPPEGDYGLDYPPMRLLTMTLWTRYTMEKIPGFQGWPNNWRLIYSANGDPATLATEDIAEPMLMVNAYAIAGASVISFFLVWLWVNRGGRPVLANRTGWTSWIAPKKILVPWKPARLATTSGLILFPLATWAFFYAVIIAENPVPAPPPSIQFAGRPILSKQSDGRYSAIITASINSQGADAQWHVDYGRTILYRRHTTDESVGSDEVTATLGGLTADTVFHYRITASNERGVTRTSDATFNTADAIAPMPPTDNFGESWLSLDQWLGIGVLFVAMCTGLAMLPPQHRGWAAGLVAALFMWLDPAVIVDSHIWPQWDAWVLPPFLLAALFGSLDWWFMAGLVLGVGVMFKGQTMIAGSLLMLWPLIAGKWRELARMGIAFVLAAGLVLSPWLVLDNRTPDWTVGPLRWIAAVLAASMISAAISLYRRPVWRRAVDIWREITGETPAPTATPAPAESEAAATAAAAPLPVIWRPQTSLFDLGIFCFALLAGIVLMTVLVLKRWPTDLDVPPRTIGLILLLGVLIPPWFLPRRTLGVWFAAIFGCSLWMSAYLFHGDWTWKTVGFEYGTRKFTRMALGIGSQGNIPQILETRWGWDVHDPAKTIHLPDLAHGLHLVSASVVPTGFLHDSGLDGSEITLDIRQFLMGVFVTLMVSSAIGLAIQSRRNHPRVLCAFAGVWVLMSNVLCQMAGRYHMWGAAMTSLLIGVSPGLTLFHIVLACIAAGMIAAQLLGSDPSRSPMLHDLFTRFGPDDGWIMLTIGLVILYIAIAPGRRPGSEELLR